MKIFISSLITGMEQIRAAAREAVTMLGHTAVMAEDFGAQPSSPQVVCLRGLRESGLVVLVLGGGYGAKQASGLSATHEEFREAMERGPVIAFVQEGVSRDADQTAFLTEVQKWESGLLRNGFSSPAQLRDLVTRRVHEWELATMAGPVSGDEMLARALARVPEEQRGYDNARALIFALAPGPRQAVLRPSEMEMPDLQQALQQAALFGSQRLFTAARPTLVRMQSHELVIDHDREAGLVRLDGEGNVTLRLPLEATGPGAVVIEEGISARLAAALRYVAWLLDRIDPKQCLTHVTPVAALTGSDHLVWRTRSEHAASPDSYSMGMGNPERRAVHLSPAHRPRPALTHQAPHIAEDLVTLLRREWRH